MSNFKFELGEEVLYCGTLSVIAEQHKAKPYGHKKNTYNVRYKNDFSTLMSMSKYVREDLIKKIQ